MVAKASKAASSTSTMKAAAPRVRDNHVVIDATQVLHFNASTTSVTLAPPVLHLYSHSRGCSVFLPQTIRHIDQQMQSAPPSTDTAANASTSTPSIDFSSFKTTAKQVTSYGATALARWDRQQYDRKRKREAGYRDEKPIKTPLKALQGMNAKNVQRREKAATRARDSGLQVQSKRKREAARREPTAGGGVRGEDVGIERGGGGRSDGMVRVGRAVAERLSRPERQMSLAKRMRSR